jgi:hypothetical protein
VTDFRIVAIPEELADHVRSHGEDPVYRHPAHTEPATGYGPCRHCLQPFEAAGEERMLFTHDSFLGAEEGLPQPGPVFIHADGCERYAGAEFPPALHFLPVTVEGYASGGSLRRQERVGGHEVDGVVADLLSDDGIDYVQLRNTEAGCYVARAVRA